MLVVPRLLGPPSTVIGTVLLPVPPPPELEEVLLVAEVALVALVALVLDEALLEVDDPVEPDPPPLHAASKPNMSQAQTSRKKDVIA